MNEITRRRAMQLAITMGAGAMLTIGGASTLRAQPSRAGGGRRRTRIGFIGVGGRGSELLEAALRFTDVDVPAVCDIDPACATRAQALIATAGRPQAHAYANGSGDYRRLLDRRDIDAVVVAAPQYLQAEMTIAAFKANKFVGAAAASACSTIDDCWSLVRAQREYGGNYLLLEDQLYRADIMLVQNMADRGLFGELTYGLGAVDTLCRWMGIDGLRDRMQTLVAMSTVPHAHERAPGGRDGTTIALIRTEQGRLIEVRVDVAPAAGRRPMSKSYSLQGTRGACDAAAGAPHVYVEGRSPAHTWEPLDKYAAEFQPQECSAWGDGAANDVAMSQFLNSIRTGRSRFDLIDTVTWASVPLLSEQSIRAGSQPVEVPNFRQG